MASIILLCGHGLVPHVVESGFTVVVACAQLLPWLAGPHMFAYVFIRLFVFPHLVGAACQISLLIPSDGHPNVVRYFARVDSGEFIYLVLERCECTLAQAIARCAAERRKAYRRIVPAGSDMVWNNVTRLVLVPPPSEPTRRFLFELVSGVARLHDLRIVHRDLKPHNILLSSMDVVVEYGEEKDGAGGECRCAWQRGGDGYPKALWSQCVAVSSWRVCVSAWVRWLPNR